MMKRRIFIQNASAVATGILVSTPLQALSGTASAKKRVAMVGTGIRGAYFWGETLLKTHGDLLEFVGLCDINPGRVEFARKTMGAQCKTYTDFDTMMRTEKPEMLIVTTVDATHHEFIIKGLEMGADIITEKPMTTDEVKCQAILDAERRTGRKVIVGFNYRHAYHATRIKELLTQERVGRITSVDFNWYLNVYHGASYFRRWHGLRAKGGTLLVHKATHHFDLLNWWLDSDPVEVMAYGQLEHYGKNNDFRGSKCRGCQFKDSCKFYWDIHEDRISKALYVDHEHHDGYIRDNCLWRTEIDIFDKMSAQIIYANGVTVNYSLTTYSPYEGWRIAFNGMKGRLDSWEDIPFQPGKIEPVNQAERHALEMAQGAQEKPADFDEITIMDNFAASYESVKVPRYQTGHGGGDQRLHDMIFRNPNGPDPLKHMAGTRDGAMSILIGIAARKSIDEKRSVRIEELTDLKPLAKRP